MSGTARKFGPSEGATRTIAFLAEQDVFGVVIDPREAAQHVADVGADAEVVELSGVDRNAHANGPSAG